MSKTNNPFDLIYGIGGLSELLRIKSDILNDVRDLIVDPCAERKACEKYGDRLVLNIKEGRISQTPLETLLDVVLFFGYMYDIKKVDIESV